MTAFQKNPIYNLSAVLRETGLKADLVRAWERRYDLPKPQRSEGGHRLYSQYDIEILKWLKKKQAQGLSISNAVELWKFLEQSGQDPVMKNAETNRQAYESDVTVDTVIADLRQRWIKACENFDSSTADDALNRAFATNSIEIVVTEILQKGMREIGQGWQSGKLSVQQEHFASSLAERRLQTMISLSPPPTRPETILLGCPPGELHSLPVTILDLFLRRKGFNVISLGANIPLDQMVGTTLDLRPGLIVLTAQTIKTAASLLETFIALQASGIPLAYGGLIFNRIPALRESIPAHFLGEDLQTAAERAEILLIHGTGESIKPVKENPHHGLASLFQEKMVAIEYSVQERLFALGLTIGHITEANYCFNAGLLAAIKLGDPAYLAFDLEWVKLLLESRNIHSTNLQEYLNAYRAAIEENLGKAGAPITQWLGAVAA